MVINKIMYSVFINARVEAKPEIVNGLISDLGKIIESGVLPNVFLGQQLDIANATVRKIENLGFISGDKKMQIVCQPERIDVSYEDTFELAEGKEIIAKLERILAVFMNKFNLTANRIAINTESLGEKYDDSISETKAWKKHGNTMNYYRNRNICEWSEHVNSREEIEIDDSETINVIYDVTTVVENVTQEKKILLHVDINTAQENTSFRFKEKALHTFSSQILPIVGSIHDSFQEE